ncbi:MAG: (d)CMP kinase [Acidimicrobiales bacterium]
MSAVVAIDGPAGSGKSSVARALADALGYSFLDTGAMYRAVTVEALARGLDPHDGESLGELSRSLDLVLTPRVAVNGRDVEDELRSEAVNAAVSVVAAHRAVRAAMVERQREWAARQPVGTVAEGRDTATVVFPEATLKVFLTASLEERQRRRGDESAASVARRDEVDRSREASPLREAPGACVVDTTDVAVADVVKEIVACLATRTSS